MPKFKLLSDSSFDLPMPISTDHNIGIISANIVGDGETMSRFDLSLDDFYAHLGTENSLKPHVPSAEVFRVAFDLALREAEDVIVITQFASFSRMFSVAQQVAMKEFQDNITVIDSQNLSIGHAAIVYAAAELITKRGMSKVELLSRIKNDLIPHTHFLGSLYSLPFLRAHDYLSGFTFFFWRLFRIRPLLYFQQGKLVMPSHYRGKNTTYDILTHLPPFLTEFMTSNKVFITHVQAKHRAHQLADLFEDCSPSPAKVLVVPSGPFLSSLVGKGFVGFSYIGSFDFSMIKKAEELLKKGQSKQKE
ncbi:MAG: DegV family protein [Asgard group archaeon]|nr:DegV family protein [Asgard group archaeon]